MNETTKKTLIIIGCILFLISNIVLNLKHLEQKKYIKTEYIKQEIKSVITETIIITESKLEFNCSKHLDESVKIQFPDGIYIMSFERFCNKLYYRAGINK